MNALFDGSSGIQYWITYYGFIVLVLTAAIYDTWKYLIPNLIPGALIILFVTAAALSPSDVAWHEHIGSGAAVLLGGMLLYGLKWLGAGDVKFLSAISLWAGFEHLPMFLGVTFLSGGVLVLVLLGVRRMTMSLLYRTAKDDLKLPRILITGEDVPYGVAVAIGALMTSSSLPIFVT